MLLQYLPPMLLTTNRPGVNWCVRLDDGRYVIRLVGVVMR